MAMCRNTLRGSSIVILAIMIAFVAGRGAGEPVGAGAERFRSASSPSSSPSPGREAVSPGGFDIIAELAAVDQKALERAILGIARAALERSVAGDRPISAAEILSTLQVTSDVEQVLMRRSSGVFVTVVRNNAVRGCVGSIWPRTATLGDEIAQAAGSVAARDLRRPPIGPEELPAAELAVSVVGRLERAERGQEWDPRMWGVFVRSGQRTGVILPREALTHAKQVSWALEEAGIPADAPYEIYRFQTSSYGCSIELRAGRNN